MEGLSWRPLGLVLGPQVQTGQYPLSPWECGWELPICSSFGVLSVALWGCRQLRALQMNLALEEGLVVSDCPVQIAAKSHFESGQLLTVTSM